MIRKYLAIPFFILTICFSGCAVPTNNLEKWEYKQVEIDFFQGKGLFEIVKDGVAENLYDEYHKKLNELGAQGWELIVINKNSHTFKRRL